MSTPNNSNFKLAVQSSLPKTVLDKMMNNGKLTEFTQNIQRRYLNETKRKANAAAKGHPYMPKPLIFPPYTNYFARGETGPVQVKIRNRLQDGGRRKTRKAVRRRRMTRRR